MEKTNSKLLNKLLKDRRFLVALSNYSNNDLNTLLNNLSAVIDYYLSNPSAEYPTDIEKLFSKIKKSPGKYNIVVFNSESEKSLRLLGFNPDSYYQDSELRNLSGALSFLPSHENVTIYSSIKDALKEGVPAPKILYQHILKQPKDQRKPLKTGESERDYYERVIEDRFDKSGVKDKKVRRLANRILDKYLDKKITLCFLPSNDPNKRYKPTDLTLITLPSIHELLNICVMNRDFRIGEEFPLSRPVEQSKKRYSRLSYSRVEELTIDENFAYNNEELTGDISYDIDTVFGKLDTKRTRERLSTNPDKNIAEIKKSSDINLTLRNGKYTINHGRHRVLYLLYYYLRSMKDYSNRDKLEAFKKYLSIPVNVDHTIEDENINGILISLERIRPNIRFLKVDIKNDLPELLVIDGENVYHTTNEKDLLELSKFLLSNKPENKFYMGKTKPSKENYRDLMNSLIVKLKEDLFKMNLLDIIRYLRNNGYDKELDLFALHSMYTAINNRYTLDMIQRHETSIIVEAEAMEVTKKLSGLLNRIFTNNPKLVLLDTTAIVNYLKTKEEFQQYPDLYLKRSIESNEVRNKKIYEMLQSSFEESPKKL